MPDAEVCKNNEGSYDCEVKCQKGFTFNVNLSSCVGKYFISTFQLFYFWKIKS